MSAPAFTAEDLRWVVCPVCRQTLQLEAEAIQCKGCGRRYPIVDGIPVLLADRAL
ncbi:MAG TPA: Trm112 family protein [Edaphobacter sp.]|nr:Trm112 family protein [Edaphobacter sp.]